MPRKVVVSLLAAVLASLSACKPSDRLQPGPILTLATPEPVAPRPQFYVSISRDNDHSHSFHGLGWVPGSKVEIVLIAEPILVNEGRELAAANPRVVATVTADINGSFGYQGPDIKAPIDHVLCGDPPPQLPPPQHSPRPVFMARDQQGKHRFYDAFFYIWFTRQACH